MAARRFLRRSRRGAANLALCVCLLALAGCGALGEGNGSAPGDQADARTERPAERIAAVSPGLVPAPAVFEATGTARWDGRRTLQGVWVAHPQAGIARRVRIYNTASGAAVDGALFGREATLKGPAILVSSDAAGMLGMAPGEETELRVVAVQPRDAAGAGTLAAGVSAAPPSAAPPSAVPPSASSPSAARPSTGAPSPAASASAASRRTVQPSAAAVAEPPARAAAPAPAPIAEAAPTLEPAGTRPGVAELPSEPDRALAADRQRTEEVASAAPAPAPAPAAPAAPAATASTTDAEKPVPPVAAIQAPDAATGAAAPSAGPLAQPYIQAGLFAVAGNAEGLIRRLDAEGLPAIGKPVRLATGPATRVLAGPFETAAERDAAGSRIRAMGLRDAIPVAR